MYKNPLFAAPYGVYTFQLPWREPDPYTEFAMTMIQQKIAEKLGHEPEDVGVVQGANLVLVAIRVFRRNTIPADELSKWLHEEGITTAIVRYV